jgi:hypothetical protein
MPCLDPEIFGLLGLHLRQLTITYYQDQPDSSALISGDLSSFVFTNQDVELSVWGGAINMHTEFSERYRNHLLNSKEIMAVNTQVLVIRWLFRDRATTISTVDNL